MRARLALICGLTIVSLGAAQAAETELQAARRLLAARSSGDSVSVLGGISLQGYEFHREVEIGQGIRVILISCNLHGGLLSFRSSGSRIASISSNQITGLQLVDLDEDGISEIVTEEIESRGTGILVKNFELYKVSPESLRRLWSARSYYQSVPSQGDGARDPSARREDGFLRFDSSGGDKPARLTYLLLRPETGSFAVKVFALSGDVLKQLSSSER